MFSVLLVFLFSTPREDFDQAVEAYRNGLYGPALYAMEQLLLEPGFEAQDSALLIAGQSAFALSRYDKALRYLERHLAESSDPDPYALERCVISSLELGQLAKSYELFMKYPRLEPAKDVKLRLAMKLEEAKEYERARDVYMTIDDPDLRLMGAKMLLAAGRQDLLRPYLADLEKTYPQVAATVASLQIDATLARADSLSSMEAGLAMGEPSTINPAQAYALGKLFESFSLYEDAVEYFESASKQHYYDALLPLASSYSLLGNTPKALKAYDDARKKLSFTQSDRALEAKARILSGLEYDARALTDASFKTWDEFEKVLDALSEKKDFQTYDRLLSLSKFERVEDILRRARFANSRGLPKEALDYYSDFLKRAPYSVNRSEVQREADIIKYFEFKDADAALKKLVRATTSSEKGKILFEDAKDYEGAISFLDTVATPQAFYYSALSYERLYLKDGKVRLLDKARERYENLYWQFPEDALVEDALYRLFLIELRDPLKKMERALNYLDHFPEGRYSDEIRFLLGGVQLSLGDTVAARSEWENLYLTKPKSSYNLPVLYELAELALLEADTSDASAKFNLILSISPHDTVYYLALKNLAEIEESRGRNLEALSLYRNMAVELGVIPRDIWHKALGLIFKLRQYNELDEFARALEDSEYQDEISFWIKVAKVESQLAKVDDVKSLMHQRPAALKDPYLYWSGVGLSLVDHNRLGRHLLERLVSEGRDSSLVSKADFLVAQHQLAGGEDSNAVATLRKLYAANPTDTLVLSKLVTALYRSGELKEADSLWMRLDLLSPGDQSALLLEKVGYLLNAGSVDEADKVLSSLSNVRSLMRNENYIYYKGLTAAKAGRQEEALENFKAFLEAFPRSQLVPAVHFKLGTLFYMIQELDSAALHYSDALAAPDLRSSALRNLAVIARNKKEYNKAFEYFETLVNESSSPEERGDLYTELGITAYNAYKFSQAVMYFEKATPLVTKDRARLLYWTARSYAAFADPEHTEKAVSLFLKCHDEFPQDQWGLESWFQAGSGYVQLERLEDARVIFEAIIASRGINDPFGMRAQEALDELK